MTGSQECVSATTLHTEFDRLESVEGVVHIEQKTIWPKTCS
jgi:hypothetical protein